MDNFRQMLQDIYNDCVIPLKNYFHPEKLKPYSKSDYITTLKDSIAKLTNEVKQLEYRFSDKKDEIEQLSREYANKMLTEYW
jgi:predicted RNase H-like nuclease (RuvC/YqgF family)